MLNRVHHIAIICSDYQKSKHFYTEILELKVIKEVYRSDRNSYKLDLSVGGSYQIELFSFPDPPQRVNRPEACGLRHLAFAVTDVTAKHAELSAAGVDCEAIRIDEYTDKPFFFIADPDGLPIEFYSE